MRFLIVDDAEAPLKVLRRVLDELGHEVVGEANNGQAAVDEFHRLLPDVVIMDVIMPRMSGLEALQVIRGDDPDARVIMACSLNSCETVLASERGGAAFCLSKPFNENCLRTAIGEIEAHSAPLKPAAGAPLFKGGPRRQL